MMKVVLHQFLDMCAGSDYDFMNWLLSVYCKIIVYNLSTLFVGTLWRAHLGNMAFVLHWREVRTITEDMIIYKMKCSYMLLVGFQCLKILGR